MPTLVYHPAYRLFVSVPGWDGSLIDWLYQNHPDWIVYKNDRVTPAWEFSNTTYPPVDIANPAVGGFLLQQMMSQTSGFQGVGLDNTTATNAYLVAGHYEGTRAPCDPGERPACGGVWVQEYDGVTQTDPAWTANNLRYLNFLRGRLAAAGLSLICNLGYQGGTDFVRTADACTGILAEGVPQSGGRTVADDFLDGMMVDGLFERNLYDAERVSRRPYAAVSYLNSHDRSAITPAEAEYATAWMLLVGQNPRENFLFAGVPGSQSVEPYPAEMRDHLAIGHALTPPPPVAPYASPAGGVCGLVGQVNAGACARPYSNGWVFMNPVCRWDGSACRVASNSVYVPPPPPGRMWRDMFGAPVSAGPRRLPPATALVIVGWRE